MFERYNINDLFLASISIMKPDNNTCDVNVGNMFMGKTTGYGYSTILRKTDNRYIDLLNTSLKISTTRDPEITSYVIDYIEPLSKYYTQDGKKKEIFSKRQALTELERYYDAFQDARLAQVQEKFGKNL